MALRKPDYLAAVEGCAPDDLPDGRHMEFYDEHDPGAPWIGDPWYFDMRCANCGHVFVNTIGFCPRCDGDEVMPIGW